MDIKWSCRCGIANIPAPPDLSLRSKLLITNNTLTVKSNPDIIIPLETIFKLKSKIKAVEAYLGGWYFLKIEAIGINLELRLAKYSKALAAIEYYKLLIYFPEVTVNNIWKLSILNEKLSLLWILISKTEVFWYGNRIAKNAPNITLETKIQYLKKRLPSPPSFVTLSDQQHIENIDKLRDMFDYIRINLCNRDIKTLETIGELENNIAFLWNILEIVSIVLAGIFYGKIPDNPVVARVEDRLLVGIICLLVQLDYSLPVIEMNVKPNLEKYWGINGLILKAVQICTNYGVLVEQGRHLFNHLPAMCCSKYLLKCKPIAIEHKIQLGKFATIETALPVEKMIVEEIKSLL